MMKYPVPRTASQRFNVRTLKAEAIRRLLREKVPFEITEKQINYMRLRDLHHAVQHHRDVLTPQVLRLCLREQEERLLRQWYRDTKADSIVVDSPPILGDIVTWSDMDGTRSFGLVHEISPETASCFVARLATFAYGPNVRLDWDAGIVDSLVVPTTMLTKYDIDAEYK